LRAFKEVTDINFDRIMALFELETLYIIQALLVLLSSPENS
jgi:hypothetical protein